MSLPRSERLGTPFFLGVLLALLVTAQLSFRASAQDADIPVRRAVPVQPTQEPPVATPAPTPEKRDESEIRIAPAAPGPQANPANPAQLQLDLANGFYSRKLYDLAAPEYEKFLGLYADSPLRDAALFRLGESYRILGNLNAAKSSYETLVAAFTASDFLGPAAYRLGDLYYQEKNFSAALGMFRKAAARAKDPAIANSAKFQLARSMEATKSFYEARQVYGELVAAEKNNPFRDASRLALAQLLADADRKPEALKQLQALVQETDKPELKVEATAKIGLLQIDLGDSEKAAATLKSVLQMPESGKWRDLAQLGVLRMLYASGKYKELLESFKQGSFSKEVQPEALLLAANAQRQLGQHAEARTLYEQLAKDYPETSYAKEARYERLVSFYNADDPKLLAEVDAWLAQNADGERRDRVLLLKAETLFKKKDYAAALPIYEKMDETKLPSALKAEALYKLGWCSMQLKMADRAVKAFSNFLINYPNHKLNTSALAERAMAQQELKNFPAALKDFNELITRYPKAKERELALQQKALLLGQQQDNAGMSEAFKKLLKEYPKSPAAPQANYWIGWAAFEAKDYKNAIEPLDLARKADKEQFFERATLRIMLANYYLEQKDALAKEVDAYVDDGGTGKVPAEVLRWLGGEFFTAGDFSKAEKYLGELTARPEEAMVDDWLNLARSEVKQKKSNEAEKAIDVYLKTTKQPGPRATGLLVLGEAQLGNGQFDDAQKSVDEACSLQPEGRLNAEGRTLSGQIQIARGDYDKAAKIFLSVAVVFDDPAITPRALEQAYLALKKSGDEKQAAKVLNDLQSRYPEYHVSTTPS